MTVSGASGSSGDNSFGGKSNKMKTTDWLRCPGAIGTTRMSRIPTSSTLSESRVHPELSSDVEIQSEEYSAGDAPAAADPASDKDTIPPSGAKSQGIRQQIYYIMDDPSYNNVAKIYSIFIMLIILMSTVTFVLESEASKEGGIMYGDGDNHRAKDAFQYIELSCVIIFTSEYLLRLITCPQLVPFLVNLMNLVDLIAWMPYWIVLAVEGGFDSAGGGTNFGFIRAVRLVRVFRVFKFGRYSVGIQMFLGAVAKSKQPLGVLLFMVCISTTIISSIMFMVEDDVSDERLSNAGVSREEHDTCYATIVRACWWCIVTMTTVGYGDCYPLSVAGKLMAMVTMLLGVLILALPITVVGSNFHKMVEMYEEDMDDYAETDKNNSGSVDEYELRAFVANKKKNGTIRKGTDLHTGRLMARYDPQGNGMLSMLEFTQLKNDIIDENKADPTALLFDVQSLLLKQQKQLLTLQATVDELVQSSRGAGNVPVEDGVAPNAPSRQASRPAGGSTDVLAKVAESDAVVASTVQ